MKLVNTIEFYGWIDPVEILISSGIDVGEQRE